MGLFPETIARDLAGGKVEAATLFDFDFTTTPMLAWRGYGQLKTKDGRRWNALGDLGSVSGIEQAVNGEAPEATFTLSGINAEIMRLARDEFEDEVRGRTVRAYIQFFGVEDEADPGNQRPLDLPYPIWGGRFLKPRFSIDRDSGERSVGITAESIHSLRSRPRAGSYTDRDQQFRFPGDKGFEFVATLINKVLTWPDY